LINLVYPVEKSYLFLCAFAGEISGRVGNLLPTLLIIFSRSAAFPPSYFPTFPLSFYYSFNCSPAQLPASSKPLAKTGLPRRSPWRRRACLVEAFFQPRRNLSVGGGEDGPASSTRPVVLSRRSFSVGGSFLPTSPKLQCRRERRRVILSNILISLWPLLTIKLMENQKIFSQNR